MPTAHTNILGIAFAHRPVRPMHYCSEILLTDILLATTTTKKMDNQDKTKEQLINELEASCKHSARFEELESRHQHTYAELLDENELYRSILEASPN